MKRASISEAKNQLSALIDGLKNGASVLILDRGAPVARLEPVEDVAGQDDGRLSRLVRTGVLRARAKPPARNVFTTAPPSPSGGTSAVASLLRERREGR